MGVAEVFIDVLPMALAIAASPFPVVPAILFQLTPQPRLLGGAFLAGWLGAIGAATTVAAVLAGAIADRGYPPSWVAQVAIVLGLVLLVIGIRQWLRRHEAGETPAWITSIEDATPWQALRLGALLSGANPKVMLLVAAGGLVIGGAELPISGAVGAVIGFTMVASVTVALPVAAQLVLGERVLPPLRSVRDWLMANNAAVMAAVICLIGCYLIAKGAAAL